MIKKAIFLFWLIFFALLGYGQHAVVFQSDFGVKDGAVAAMKGVALSVSPRLQLFDLTHEIPAYSIWEASYRLYQTIVYWPTGTVFVSIVDPGVGSSRRSVVAKTKSGHYIVTPDNGTLTFVTEYLGIEALREIDENINRLKGSSASYTFHGRDVYAYTGARLAAGVITFEQIGPALQGAPSQFSFQKPTLEKGELKGNIPILDVQYGNVWTNIGAELIDNLKITTGEKLLVEITHDQKRVYQSEVLYTNTFAGVKEGEPLAYLNSLLNFSLAINQGNFAATHSIGTGPDWTIVVRKSK
jgi:hypothetical protein